jgi:bifunctional oligoribonuclease and PAP phosphatase NrnA
MTIAEMAAYLKARDRYVILSHDGPDADGLGAAYALCLALRAVGKEAFPAVADRLPPKFAFIDQRGLFRSLKDGPELPFGPGESMPVVVDTHDLGYLGATSEALIAEAGRVLVIDHHERPGADTDQALYEAFGAEGVPVLLEETASSTCELVYLVSKELGVELPLDAAEAVFAGIVYDTGSFSYPKTSERTFACALELSRGGVKPYTIHRRMYESAGPGALLLQKAVISTLEMRDGGKVAVQTLTRGDLEAAGASYEDAEDLVNIPLQDKGVEVSVLFKESSEGKLRASLRSKGSVNVAHVAQTFGGGGHKTAAGFTCAPPLDAARSDVLESLSQAFREDTRRDDTRREDTRRG